ncbi:MAG: META domain-containing protein [Candidatus Azobacteroides sp.]|nr:META domain-containing protein [Candidatus Azobacteroides sp.]
MKQAIFIMGVIILTVGMNACKSNKTVENSSTEQTVHNSQNSSDKVNTDLVEKYWKLFEIFGTNLKDVPPMASDAYLTLKAEGNRAIGSGGCNNFTGTYQLGTGNRIKFSQMVSTTKMCLTNMEIEGKLHQVFEMTDSYYVNGDTLTLIRARMAPLARFEAVYLR